MDSSHNALSMEHIGDNEYLFPPCGLGGHSGQENPVAFILDIRKQKQKQLTIGRRPFWTFIYSYSHWNCHFQRI